MPRRRLGVALAVAAGRALRALRDAVFAEPLARRLSWPFEPHVTLADGIPEERLRAAVEALGDFTLSVSLDRVHLLEETRDERRVRVWRPLADAPFGPPVVVGRGGLPVELTATHLVDPEVSAATGLADPAPGTGGRPLVVAARRRGEVVGAAAGWTRNDVAHLCAVAVVPDARRQGVGRHLLAAFRAAAVERGAASFDGTAAVEAGGPEVHRFLAGQGWAAGTVPP